MKPVVTLCLSALLVVLAAPAAEAGETPVSVALPTSFAAKAWAELRKAGLGKGGLPADWLAPGPRKRPAELAARDVHEVTPVKTAAGASLVFVAGTTLAAEAPAGDMAARSPFAEVWLVSRGAPPVRNPIAMKEFHSASASVPPAQAGKLAKEVLVIHLQGTGAAAGHRYELWHAARSGPDALAAKAFVGHAATQPCTMEFTACLGFTCDVPNVEFDCPLGEAEIAAQKLGTGAWRAVTRFLQDGKGGWRSSAAARVEYGVTEAELATRPPAIVGLLARARPEVGVVRSNQEHEARTLVHVTQQEGIISIAGKNRVATTGPVLIVNEESPKPKGKGTKVVVKAYAFAADGASVVAKGVLGTSWLTPELVAIGRAGKMLATDVAKSERATEAPATPLTYKSRLQSTTTRRLWYVSGKTFQPAIEVEVEAHGPILCAGDAEGCQENSRSTTWTFGETTHNGLPDLEIVAHEVHDVMLARTITTRYEWSGQAWEAVGEDTTGD